MGNGRVRSTIDGLVRVGALTPVGAEALARELASAPGNAPITAEMVRQAAAERQASLMDSPPSPEFARSSRDTKRRAPLGFTEETTGAKFFTLAAVIGASTTMRAKVSRAAHVDRLLIVPSGPGAVIQSIFIGDEEQVLAAGAPVELYGPDALTDSVPDNFSPIGPALDMLVVLVNTTAVAITGTIGVKASVRR